MLKCLNYGGQQPSTESPHSSELTVVRSLVSCTHPSLSRVPLNKEQATSPLHVEMSPRRKGKSGREGSLNAVSIDAPMAENNLSHCLFFQPTAFAPGHYLYTLCARLETHSAFPYTPLCCHSTPSPPTTTIGKGVVTKKEEFVVYISACITENQWCIFPFVC